MWGLHPSITRLFISSSSGKRQHDPLIVGLQSPVQSPQIKESKKTVGMTVRDGFSLSALI